jgi:HK97 family phage portal protein
MAELTREPLMPTLTLRQRAGLWLAGVRASKSDREFFKSSRRAAMNTSEPLVEPYTQHSVINACVRAYGDNISGVPFKIYTSARATREGRGAARLRFEQQRFKYNELGYLVANRARPEEFQEAPDNVLTTLFDNPDPRLGSSDLFWNAVVTYMMRDGEGVGLMQDRENVAQVPKEIWAYSGHRFSIKQKENGLPLWWDFITDKGTPKPVEDHKLVRPRLINPNNLLRGLAPYHAGQVSAETDWYAMLYNRNFFQNGATLGGVAMAPPGMNKEQRKAFYDGIAERHVGVDQAFGIGLLTGANDFKEMGTNQRDMQFNVQRKFTREELAMLYRVPLTVLSTYEQVNYANARVQSRAFWQLALLPVMRWIENIYWAQLFKWVQGGRYWGAFDLSAVEALQEDLAEKLDNAKKYYDMTYPPNAINQRLELGMDELPWGDTHLVPLTVIPAEAAAGVGGTEPAAIQAANAKQNQGQQAQPATQEQAGTAPAARSSLPAPGVRGQDGRSLPPATPESQQGLSSTPAGTPGAPLVRITKAQQGQWTGWVNLVTPYERRFHATYKKYLFNLRKNQLTIIAGYGDRGAATALDENVRAMAALLRDARQGDVAAAEIIAESLLFAQEQWDARLGAVTRPIYTDTMIAAGQGLSESIGGSMLFDVTSPEVAKGLAKKEILVKETNQTLRDNLKAQLVQGIVNGETASQLQERVRVVFNFQESRSLTIARTEVVQAAGFARHDSMVAEGANTHGWLTALDENVRASHLDAQAEGMIPISQAFAATGLLYPGEMGGSAAEIINCRCVELVGDLL